MLLRLLGALLVVGVVISPLSVHAQAVGPTEQLEVTLNPQHPRPNEMVTISVRSYAIDLAAATVVVTVNGTEVERSTGFVTTQARIGGAGQTTTIVATATLGGQTYRKQVTVRPSDVALIVEPQTTAHPFYKGGLLVGSESVLRITAVPDIRSTNGARIAPQNLVYTWRKGSQILQQNSGVGRSSLTASAPARYRNAVVSVTVTTSDQSVVGYAETLIAPSDPVVRIYEHDPLLGPLFDRALVGAATMEGDEETYRAVPYFFSRAPQLTWLLNSVETGTNRDITVRSLGNGAGSARLSVSALGAGLFQAAEGSLSVRFGETNPLGIFGL